MDPKLAPTPDMMHLQIASLKKEIERQRTTHEGEPRNDIHYLRLIFMIGVSMAGYFTICKSLLALFSGLVQGLKKQVEELQGKLATREGYYKQVRVFGRIIILNAASTRSTVASDLFS